MTAGELETRQTAGNVDTVGLHYNLITILYPDMLRCRHPGVDSVFVARGETKEEVLKKVVEHAKKDHGIQEMTEEYRAAWRKAVRGE